MLNIFIMYLIVTEYTTSLLLTSSFCCNPGWICLGGSVHYRHLIKYQQVKRLQTNYSVTAPLLTTLISPCYLSLLLNTANTAWSNPPKNLTNFLFLTLFFHLLSVSESCLTGTWMHVLEMPLLPHIWFKWMEVFWSRDLWGLLYTVDTLYIYIVLSAEEGDQFIIN